MALRSRSPSLLVLVAVALRESCLGASSHSMKYIYSSISEPSQGLPQFVSVGYVDGQAFAHYDSNSRRVEPRVSWMEKVGKEKPQYWDRETQVQRGNEYRFREYLEILRLRYNQSEGLGEPLNILAQRWGRTVSCVELQRCINSHFTLIIKTCLFSVIPVPFFFAAQIFNSVPDLQ